MPLGILAIPLISLSFVVVMSRKMPFFFLMVSNLEVKRLFFGVKYNKRIHLDFLGAAFIYMCGIIIFFFYSELA